MATVPGLMGTQEAIRQSQSKNKREEHRARRCNFIAHCIKPSLRASEINDRPLILRGGHVFIDTGSQPAEDIVMACGYYLPYPESSHEGLVTKTSNHLPIMNWLYIDSATYRLRYGVRNEADGNITGPFDCTNHSRRVTLFKWEGWCAVEEQGGEWAVYFDVDDNGLHGRVPFGTRVLELELERREERYKKAEHGVLCPEETNVTNSPEPSKLETMQVAAVSLGPPLPSSPPLPTPAPTEPSKPLEPLPQAAPQVASKRSSRPRTTSTQISGPGIMDRPRMVFELQPSAPPPLKIPERRPKHAPRIRTAPPQCHKNPNRPPLQIGELPFESKLHKSSSGNPIRPPSSRTHEAPLVPRPRFRSLDISRKDVQRHERVPTDSSVQSTWSWRGRTSSGDSSVGQEKRLGKKLSIRERVTKALKVNFRNEKLFAGDT